MPEQIVANGGPQLSYADRGRVLRSLGYRVLSDINDVSVMMPTALVGTVLLTLRGRGVGKGEMVRRVEWLCERVRAKGGRVAHFYRYPTDVVVDRALEVLGPQLVGEVSGLVEPTYYAVDRFQLSFYRNMTIHLFITEALVSAGMYTRIKQGGGPSYQRISYQDLLNQVSFLSQVSQISNYTLGIPPLTKPALPWRIHLPSRGPDNKHGKDPAWTRKRQHNHREPRRGRRATIRGAQRRRTAMWPRKL